MLLVISIHAAREGGDLDVNQRQRLNMISIHAAREGGDPLLIEGIVKGILFQSTPPVKAATQAPHNTPRRFSISIHAAREGGDLLERNPAYRRSISIHAAREGGDGHCIFLLKTCLYFNPRRP